MPIKNLEIPWYTILLVLFTVALTAFVMFLTPLRYITLIEPKIHDVEAEEIYTAMSARPQEYLFIDVRTSEDYRKLHAKGSVNIPIVQFYDQWRDFPKTGKQIVLICGGGRLSGIAFFFLQHFGFTNIARVSGGVEEWVSKNLPVVLQETSA